MSCIIVSPTKGGIISSQSLLHNCPHYTVGTHRCVGGQTDDSKKDVDRAAEELTQCKAHVQKNDCRGCLTFQQPAAISIGHNSDGARSGQNSGAQALG